MEREEMICRLSCAYFNELQQFNKSRTRGNIHEARYAMSKAVGILESAKALGLDCDAIKQRYYEMELVQHVNEA